MDKKRIIYIIGAGRSGTTLLEIILGNGHNIFNAGELNRYPYRDGVARDREPESLSYQFWDEIRSELIKKHDLAKQEKLHKQFEYHVGFVKYFLKAPYKKEEYREYQEFIYDFYKLIFNKINQPIITDSSKYPGRAMNLPKTLPYEISYIYIKRDPVNVVKSFAKKDVEQSTKGWLSANLYYFIANFLCTIALKKLRKRHKTSIIKYEELIEEPSKVLKQVETELTINLQDVIQKIQENKLLDICPYIFDANRIRFQTNIKIRKSSKENNLNFLDKLARLVHYPLYH